MNRIEQCFEIEFREEFNLSVDTEIALSKRGLSCFTARETLRESYIWQRFLVPEPPAQHSHHRECPKCGGTGYIRQYSFNAGGVCFRCGGTGKAS